VTGAASTQLALADELVALASALAREAGTMALAGRIGGIASRTAKSSATDMVTEFDHASERLIVDAIRAARPDDGLVGEEGSLTTGTSGVHWLIDPIDGTTNFLYGLPGWAVSIAALDADGALAGAVYVPSQDELFAARRGGGATLDGTPLRCGVVASAAQALVATGFGYRTEQRARQGARVASLLPLVRDIRRFGAAAVDLCYVAAGRLDAYFEEGLGPWDFAAGELIAREAGCRSGDFGDGRASSDELLVANPALFDEVRSLIVSTANDR
jgi:myo-inositol-1(or 4)-monophosphatase